MNLFFKKNYEKFGHVKTYAILKQIYPLSDDVSGQ